MEKLRSSSPPPGSLRALPPQRAQRGETDQLDAQMHAACDAGDYGAAASLFFERHGPEILAFLGTRLRSRSDADEVFGVFAEKLWVGLPQFEWRCSLRSWAYRLARNSANDFVELVHQRPERRASLGADPALEPLLERARTTTAAYLRTSIKDQMQLLRETLPPDDQLLIILRVDRDMDFRELAVVMSGAQGELDETALERDAARLRKRFERVKERLRKLAQEAGLI